MQSTSIEATNSFLLARMGTYIMRMKKGDLIEYINMDGDPVYGVVCKGIHKHVFEQGLGTKSAVKVAWTDDLSVTTEVVKDILDPDTTMRLL